MPKYRLGETVRIVVPAADWPAPFGPAYDQAYKRAREIFGVDMRGMATNVEGADTRDLVYVNLAGYRQDGAEHCFEFDAWVGAPPVQVGFRREDQPQERAPRTYAAPRFPGSYKIEGELLSRVYHGLGACALADTLEVCAQRIAGNLVWTMADVICELENLDLPTEDDVVEGVMAHFIDRDFEPAVERGNEVLAEAVAKAYASFTAPPDEPRDTAST